MTPYGGRRPELGWTLHMTGGWQSQWDRVTRWYGRAVTAQNPVDRYDFFYAFFESAFHLRDWLRDSDAATSEALDSFFDGTAEMRLCRDLANSHKHFSIRNPSQPHPPSEVHEYSPEAGSLADDVSLVILSDGEKYDAFELAQRVFSHWASFLSANVPKALAEGGTSWI